MLTLSYHKMSDSQPQQESCDNSPPSSPAQSYLPILPSDSISSIGIAWNSQDLIQLTVDPQLLRLGDVNHARFNQYPTRPHDIGSAISTISDLTDTPSSLLTTTIENTPVAHSNLSTIPEHFLTTKKLRKSWVGNSAHGEEYLDETKWRWRCVTGAPYREVNSKVATAPKLKVEDKDRVNNSRRIKTVKLNIVKLKASLN